MILPLEYFEIHGNTLNIRDPVLHEKIEHLIDLIHPIGCIYLSMSGVSPALLFGGVWEQLTDTFLLCSTESGVMGGSKTHKLTVDEMPSHTHTQQAHTHTQQAHTHTQQAHTHTQNEHSHIYASELSSYSGLKAVSRYTPETTITYGIDSDINREEITTKISAFNTNNVAGTNNDTTAVNNDTTAVNNDTIAINENTGGDTPFSIMPVYTTVFAWKRIG